MGLPPPAALIVKLSVAVTLKVVVPLVVMSTSLALAPKVALTLFNAMLASFVSVSSWVRV